MQILLEELLMMSAVTITLEGRIMFPDKNMLQFRQE